jgi:hypothetical protein
MNRKGASDQRSASAKKNIENFAPFAFSAKQRPLR